MVDTVEVKDVALSPDGASVLFTRSRWRSEGAAPGPAWTSVWRVSSAGGEPTRITFADGRDTAPHFSPDGRTIAFLSQRGEEEKVTRVFVMPASGGESRPLTGKELNVTELAWSPDGTSIAFVAKEPKSPEQREAEEAGRDEIVVDQNLRPRRLWILDVASGTVAPVVSLGDLSVWAFGWAPDGSALVATVSEHNRTDDSYMFKWLRVLPLEGEGRDLVPIVGKLGDVAWSPDGEQIAWLGGVDGSDPFEGSLFVVSSGGGAPRNLTGAREETGRSLAWTPEGRIALTAITGTATGVWFVDPASGEREVAVAPGAISFTETRWAADGRLVALVGSTADDAPDVFVALPGEVPRRVTRSHPQLEELPRGTQETIRYVAGDGLEVEGVVIRPAGFDEGTRHPLVVIAHGGPEGQFLEAWNNSYSRPGHALAERGYVVFFPNYRARRGAAWPTPRPTTGTLGEGIHRRPRWHRRAGGGGGGWTPSGSASPAAPTVVFHRPRRDPLSDPLRRRRDAVRNLELGVVQWAIGHPRRERHGPLGPVVLRARRAVPQRLGGGSRRQG